jgi:hypothetical protein
MANSASGNVHPLGVHPRARSRLTSQESASVLAGCRELALSRISVALASMLDRVEDDLFEMAESSVEREAREAYLDARSHSRAHRSEIESTFRRHFLEVFNRKVTGDGGPPPAAEETTLSLVDDDELEQSIAVSEMSRKLQAACDGELFALSRRMGFLLERPELPDDANPVSPATICAALRDACDQIQAGFKVRMTLLRQFERHAEAELQRIYHDLNAHLVQQRILPEVKAEVRRTAATPRAIRPEPAKEATPAPDAFGALAQLLGARGVPPGPDQLRERAESVGRRVLAPQRQVPAPPWPTRPAPPRSRASWASSRACTARPIPPPPRPPVRSTSFARSAPSPRRAPSARWMR